MLELDFGVCYMTDKEKIVFLESDKKNLQDKVKKYRKYIQKLEKEIKKKDEQIYYLDCFSNIKQLTIDDYFKE